MSILQKIFSDHFYKLLNSNIKIRDTVIENVDKMIHCGDYKRGYALYICEHCFHFMVSPFRCRSRFCTSCGNLYSRKRSTAMSFKLIRTSHRHCVFTIPEELRIFFRKDRSLLNLLFRAAADAIFFMFKKLNKSENFTPGFVCVLHTFGRSLQWNPHIHMLISEGASGNFSVWRVVKHFHYELLRKSFRLTLLNYLEAHFGKSFKKVKSYIYKHCPNGFYVYAKPTLANNQDVLKYIGRYLGRPVIATSRIDNYDGENVTFHYNRHEDNELITETVSAVDFIKKLIIHIPEKHFKMIRYYGIYAKHHKHEDKLHLFIPKEKRRFHILRNSWRTSISLSFHFDPLLCKCGHKMTLFQICLNGTPFFEKSKSWGNSS